MWDVNFEADENEYVSIYLEFDLNYVGCELVFCVVNRILVKTV